MLPFAVNFANDTQTIMLEPLLQDYAILNLFLCVQSTSLFNYNLKIIISSILTFTDASNNDLKKRKKKDSFIIRNM